MKHKHVLGIICIIALIAFANSLNNELVYDDMLFHEWHSNVGLAIIPSLFTQGATIPGQLQTYGPIAPTLYSLSVFVYKDHIFALHVQALIVHILASFLIFKITIKLTKKYFLSLAATLFFTAHPVHTESISLITASFDSLGLTLALASFYLYLEQKKNLSLILSVIAFFTYELALPLPFLFLSYEFFYTKKYKTTIPYFIGLAFYAAVRFIVGIAPNKSNLTITIPARILLQGKTHLIYLKQTFLPTEMKLIHPITDSILSITHNHTATTLSHHGLLTGSTFLGLALIALMLVGMWKCRHSHKLLSFSLSWYFIALLPVSNFVPQNTILAERYLYLASFGLILAFSILLYKIKNKNTFLKVAGTILLILLLLTVSRNHDWDNEERFWKRTIGQAPNSANAHLNYAVALQNAGENPNAIPHFQKALELNPSLYQAHNNLAVAYIKQGEFDQAQKILENLIQALPNYAKAHYNLGLAYEFQEKPQQAIQHYTKALEIQPNYPLAEKHLNMLLEKNPR